MFDNISIKLIFSLLSTFVASSFLFAADYTNSIGMKFKDIPAGSFTMGTATPNCPKDNPFTKNNEYEECLGSIYKTETPAHRVNVGSFYMQESEVTQRQWYEVMGSNPSEFQNGNPDMPVETVSWDDAQKFISRLNQKEGGNKYRLPTEEEWEYAARAGTTTKWYCGDNESCVSAIAVYNIDLPKPVKSKKPNAFGLYDMSGNVCEWTHSCYTEDYNKGCFENYKVIRGGGWYNGADSSRPADRDGVTPDRRSYGIGFRLLRMK